MPGERPQAVNSSERVLILAPESRDGALAADLLANAGQNALCCTDLSALLAELEEGAGAAIVSEEAVSLADLRPISAWIEGQPAWSDFPFVVLTRQGGGTETTPALGRIRAVFGNVIFLERPFHPTSLVSVVENALRGRRRQYQARALLDRLREGEMRLSTALRAGRLGAWELDIAEGRLEASDQCKACFGLPADAPFSYADFRNSVAPADRPAVSAALERAIATGEDFAVEHRVLWPDGSEQWLDVRARVLAGKAGRPETLVGVVSVITERKAYEAARDQLVRELADEREQTEEALRGEKALSDLLMTSAPAGIVAYDRELRITVWNPLMENLVGIEAAAVVGKSLFDVIAAEHVARMDERVRDALDGIPGPTEELEFATEDGKVWLETQHAPLEGGDGQIVGGIAFFRDVTERRRAEEQLRQAQKMETIGQLTGGVAHDFNNLLSAVLGNLELLRKKLPPDPQLLRHVDGAIQGAQRGASLTQRLLAFARRQDLQPTPTDLVALIEGMRALVERSIGPQIAVEVDLPAGLPPATVDPNQLELAILNLAVNARDAMPDGGTLSITLEQRPGEISGMGLRGSFIRLVVADTGIGMDAATLESAIEPFFSTKELGKGTGLGLSMVHGLAVQLGGALKLSSQLGKGTVAELWLPVSTAPVKKAQEMQKIPAEVPASHILIVDDDALIAMNTFDMVEDLGHHVIEAYSGKQALEILQSDAQVDALITDYAMPGMTGVELAEKARVLRPDLPILLATGYADLPSGTTTDLPRLAKPYQQRDLAQQLAKLLGGTGE